MRYPIFTFIFIILITLEILLPSRIPEINLLTKGALVASIMTWYIVNVNRQNKTYIIALIFALTGDLLLAFGTNEAFLLGMAAFAVMQILYISIFLKGYAKPRGWRLYVSIALLLIYLGFVLGFGSNFKELFIPVTVYGALLTTMTITAVNIRNRSISPISIGALFFLLSDVLIGIDKFIVALPMEHFLVITTYSIAQYLIAFGLVESFRVANERAIAKVKTTKKKNRN
jgi:uncharacterized membrane protein YhhN